MASLRHAALILPQDQSPLKLLKPRMLIWAIAENVAVGLPCQRFSRTRPDRCSRVAVERLLALRSDCPPIFARVAPYQPLYILIGTARFGSEPAPRHIDPLHLRARFTRFSNPAEAHRRPPQVSSSSAPICSSGGGASRSFRCGGRLLQSCCRGHSPGPPRPGQAEKPRRCVPALPPTISVGDGVQSVAQSLKDDLNPCGTMSLPSASVHAKHFNSAQLALQPAAVGTVEGLWLRSPYRCTDCGNRPRDHHQAERPDRL
jgi:hypothetical protein